MFKRLFLITLTCLIATSSLVACDSNTDSNNSIAPATASVVNTKNDVGKNIVPETTEVSLVQLFENPETFIGKRILVRGEVLDRSINMESGQRVEIVIGDLDICLFAATRNADDELFYLIKNGKVKQRRDTERQSGDIISVEGIFLGVGEKPEFMGFPMFTYPGIYAGMKLERIILQ